MSEERKGLLRCGCCTNYDVYSEKCKLWQNSATASDLACGAYESWEAQIASLKTQLLEAQAEAERYRKALEENCRTICDATPDAAWCADCCVYQALHPEEVRK